METEADELGEDQALLILYLSGELSADRHAELERRLESDAALRKELEGLRSAQAMIWREMLAADSMQPPKSAASSAHRKLAGMVRQWAVQRLSREPAPVSGSHSMRRWGIALAAAATIAIASLLYLREPATTTEIVPPQEVATNDSITEELPSDDLLASAGLNEVEQELEELAHLRSLE